MPGLYTHEELEPLLSPLKEAMMEDGSCRTPYEYFVSRIQRHLHLAIAMDATNDKFAMRCESNPALYTRCAIVWMGEWASKSMRALPAMYEGLETLLNPPPVPGADSADAAPKAPVGADGKKGAKGSKGAKGGHRPPPEDEELDLGGEAKGGESKGGGDPKKAMAESMTFGDEDERDADAAEAAAALSPLCGTLVQIHEAGRNMGSVRGGTAWHGYRRRDPSPLLTHDSDALHTPSRGRLRDDRDVRVDRRVAAPVRRLPRGRLVMTCHIRIWCLNN